MGNRQQQPVVQKPPADDPCRPQRIDFQICQRKLGFNDKVCRFYLNEFEQCINRHSR